MDDSPDLTVPAKSFDGTKGNYTIRGLIAPTDAPLRPLAEGERALGGFILPPFQRPPKWTKAQQIRLIESLYKGIPVPALIYNQTKWGHQTDGWLIDGQQRMTAILDYVSGAFPIIGHFFPDLSEAKKRLFLSLGIPVVESKIEDVATCHDIYLRLAYGGTPHDPLDESALVTDLRTALQAALNWIDAVPSDRLPPSMPALDRDWVNSRLAGRVEGHRANEQWRGTNA